MNAVAKNLKTIRTQKGYTQDDLAQALHVTRQTVSSWETGRSEPDIKMLTALAETLQTDVTTLIYGPAKTPYQTMQEKYKVWSLILGLFVLAGLVAYVWLQPWLLDYRRQTYDMRPGILYQTLLVPVCTVATGALLPCILSLWINTAIRKPWRYLLLVFGVLALVPILGTALQFAIWEQPPGFTGVSQLTLWFPFALRNMISLGVWSRGMPFLGGICLFLGLNREIDH